MDLVYVLGTGSQWFNNEIRYSLRAIEKNITGFRNVYVIGEDPGLINVKHIPYPDELGPSNADGNIIRKVLRACREKALSEEFLFINDDHLITKPIDIAYIPPFHKGDMRTYHDNYWKLNPWRERLRRTMVELERQGLPTHQFECHTPIIFNKVVFPKIMNRFDYATGIGFTMKSLYGNCVYPNAPKLKSEKTTVFNKYNLDDLRKKCAGRQFVSFNDDGMNYSLRAWLYEQFPKPSSFERGDIEDPVVEILKYFDGEQDFETGRLLFNRYCHGTNLKKLFLLGESPSLKRKLHFKLKMKIQQLHEDN